MFEYHGWVAIAETPGAESDDASLKRTVERVGRRMSDLGDYGLLDLRWLNGSPFLHFAGLLNHRGRWGDEILDLFEHTGRLAPGSYGLLYLRDHTDPFQGNEFRVCRMAKGQVTEHDDPFLSPAVPTVEDALD
ncbi:Imm7 family immunity protein [Amycolatopsis minnesotensis]|uniref:Immunity 7 family protein n=1 Tax=Amycolatopsis minnesotensis TaxID=337894 RepID=A0ABN2RDF8_9PSEU